MIITKKPRRNSMDTKKITDNQKFNYRVNIRAFALWESKTFPWFREESMKYNNEYIGYGREFTRNNTTETNPKDYFAFSLNAGNEFLEWINKKHPEYMKNKAEHFIKFFTLLLDCDPSIRQHKAQAKKDILDQLKTEN